MKILDECYTLSNGIEIPKLGLGTWMMENAVAKEAVKQALSIGYHHIDTAQAYENESGVGEGVLSSGIPRNEIFVTSKVAAECKTYDTALQSINESISRMGLEYIDMMIIHSPQPWSKWRNNERYFEENIEVWRALEAAYRDGKVRAIGVSNFLIDDLQNILNHCTVKPMVNQVLMHIGQTPFGLMDFCRKENILLEAYSPIAHGEILKNHTIGNIAKKYDVSIPQLCIKYALNMKTIVLPKTTQHEHMKSNTELDFDISDADMRTLKEISFNDYGEYSFFPVFSGK